MSILPFSNISPCLLIIGFLFLLPSVPCLAEQPPYSEKHAIALEHSLAKSNQNVYTPTHLHSTYQKSLNLSKEQTVDQVVNHAANANTEQKVENKFQRIAKIAELLQHSRDLHRKILYERERNEKATAQFHTSLKRLSDLSAARSRAQKAIRLMQRQLKEYRRQAPLYASTLDILHKQAGAAILEINRLRTSKYSVMHEKALLQDHFRQRGLEAWVQNYLKDSVNPLVAGAVVEGTANVVEPMLDGIETLATVNEDITRKMASQLRESVPIVEKPFYSGFVTYTVLLFPLVLVTSILLKIKRSLTRLSAGHVVILGNFYFTLLSGGCFIATLLGSVDVLLTFRHVNLGMFDLVMVLHGVLYIIHVSLHILMAARVGDKAFLFHTFLLILVGSHFFIHSYLHAFHNEDPHVDKKAYAVYTGVFAYILYNWTVKYIRMSMESTRMNLNNKSIPTVEHQALVAVADKPSAVGTHLPSTQQKLVSSSMSNAVPEDGISRIAATSGGEIRIDNIFYSAPTVLRVRDFAARLTYGTGSCTRTTQGMMKADDPKDL